MHPRVLHPFSKKAQLVLMLFFPFFLSKILIHAKILEAVANTDLCLLKSEESVFPSKRLDPLPLCLPVFQKDQELGTV